MNRFLSKVTLKAARVLRLDRAIPDEPYLKLMYKVQTGCDLDLDSPQTFNEKLNWLKLHDRNPLYTTLVDKYRVKQWVADRIGEQYVVPTLAFWESADEIDISGLPDRFVLKTNHDSGGVAICRDKKSFDLEAARAKLDKSLRRNYFWQCREWPYKDVKPLVFAEEYLDPTEEGCNLADYKLFRFSDVSEIVAAEPNDYKFLCFDGEPRLIEVHQGRSSRQTQDFMWPDWTHADILQSDMPCALTAPERPSHLDEMLRQSAVLSEGFPHVRVDWYDFGPRPLFGEMTFYDGGGFDPFDRREDDELLGSWIEIGSAHEEGKAELR